MQNAMINYYNRRTPDYNTPGTFPGGGGGGGGYIPLSDDG